MTTRNLLIREVPEEVRDVLAARARARGQSLQAFLHDLVSDEARREANLRLLVAVRDVGGGAGAADPDAAELLRAEREEREAYLTDPAQTA